MCRAAALAIALLCLCVSVTFAADPEDVAVTSCGQVIPKKTLGYLTADLDCTGFTGGPANVMSGNGGAAVYLEKKSRLDLRGFTITGGIHGVVCNALLCRNDKPCSQGPCEVFNGSIVASVYSGNGIRGPRPIVHDVIVTGGATGVIGYDRLLLSNATVKDTISLGVAGKNVTIVGTAITNHGQWGVDAYTDRGPAVRLIDSTVTGNGTAAFCGAYPCADVAGARLPRLENTTCGTSFNLSDGGSWNVCTLD